MKYTLIFTALIISLLFVSCNDDDVDTSKPSIEVIKPAEGSRHFHQGDSFDFEAIFTDNIALKSYKVEVHWGDEHDHEAVMKSTKEEYVKWEDEWSDELKQEKEDRAVISGIVVPENAEPGKYHLGVYCIDQANNQSEMFIDLEVEEEGHEH